MKITRRYKIKNDQEGGSKDDEKIRPFPLYGMLICGIIIFSIGSYMFYTETGTQGKLGPMYGRERLMTINGKAAIIFGLVICAFPVYQLIKQRKN